jgi:hypothetical protein
MIFIGFRKTEKSRQTLSIQKMNGQKWLKTNGRGCF